MQSFKIILKRQANKNYRLHIACPRIWCSSPFRDLDERILGNEFRRLISSGKQLLHEYLQNDETASQG